jgi:GrpB-like predicted nucleotidyltransferase (UPF0157 family)
VLAVEVTGPGDVDTLARRLREVDHRMVVTTAPGLPDQRYRPAVALVVATAPTPAADVVLAGENDPRFAALTSRLRSYAARLAGAPAAPPHGAPVPYDREWPRAATRRLGRLAAVFARLDGVRPCSGQHIGSTSVPGLAATPVIDLQVQVAALPPATLLDAVLAPLGYLPATGSRPDALGAEEAAQWRMRVFTGPDPELPTTLVIRQSASPFAARTVDFRDWLRANPDERDRYQNLKVTLARHPGEDRDSSLGAYFDRVQPKIETWRRH